MEEVNYFYIETWADVPGKVEVATTGYYHDCKHKHATATAATFFQHPHQGGTQGSCLYHPHPLN